MIRNILLILVTCCIATALIGQNRQKVEFRTVSVHHICIDTVAAKEQSDLDNMDIHGAVKTVKQSTIAYENGKPSIIQNQKCSVYQFDEKGNTVEESDGTLTGTNNATMTRSNVYAYNKLQEIVYYDAQGNKMSHIKYRYNSKGDVVGWDSLKDNNVKPAYVFKYDKFHNIVYEKDFTGGSNAYEFTFNYTYDSKNIGRILVKSVDRRHLASGAVYNYTTTYSYNDCGKVVKEELLETNGNQSLITYTYNDCDQLVTKDMQFPDATLREVYTRDAFNSVVSTYFYADNQLQSVRTNDIIYTSGSREMDDFNVNNLSSNNKTVKDASLAQNEVSLEDDE